MAVVNVMVNNRAYTIACDDGEEDHLRELAGHVDHKVKELLSSVGQVGDNRLILMAALLITDDLFDAKRKLEAHVEHVGELHGAQDALHSRLEESEGSAAEALEKATAQLEEMTAKLAAA